MFIACRICSRIACACRRLQSKSGGIACQARQEGGWDASGTAPRNLCDVLKRMPIWVKALLILFLLAFIGGGVACLMGDDCDGGGGGYA